MRKVTTAVAALSLLSLLGVGCASSHQEGVTTNYRKQWIDVYADVEATTAAAKQVFTDDKLADISVDVDKVKGEVSATFADKTKIYASVVKIDKGSQLTVQAGKYLGDPKLGSEYAAKIKQVAEGKKM